MAGKGNRPKSSKAKPSTSQAGKGVAQPVRRAALSAAQTREQMIPEAVANRMARRIAIATGIPTLMGMGVFVGSYVLVTRQIADIAPGLTLTASGGCFLLGLLGLSYGVLSASWESHPGSLLGTEQLGLNIGRIKQSLAAMRNSSGRQQG